MFGRKPVKSPKPLSSSHLQNQISKTQELMGDKNMENNLKDSEHLKIPAAAQVPCVPNNQCTPRTVVLSLSDCIIKPAEKSFVNSSLPYNPIITPAQAFPAGAFEEESPQSQRGDNNSSPIPPSSPYPSIVAYYARQILNDLNNRSEVEEKEDYGFSSYRDLSGSMECSSSDSDS